MNINLQFDERDRIYIQASTFTIISQERNQQCEKKTILMYPNNISQSIDNQFNSIQKKKPMAMI